MKKQKEYDDGIKKYLEQFKEIKNHVELLFESLNCKKEMTHEKQIMFMRRINKNNIMFVFAQIKKK